MHMRPCPQVVVPALVKVEAATRRAEKKLVLVAMAVAEVAVARRVLPLAGAGALVLVKVRSLEAAGVAPKHRAHAQLHHRWHQWRLGRPWVAAAQMLLQVATMGRWPRLAVTCHSLLAARVRARDAASKLHRGW